MKTLTTKPCLYCAHPIDLENDNYKRLATLKSVLGKSADEYIHELCAAEMQREDEQDRAYETWMDQREEMGYVENFELDEY